MDDIKLKEKFEGLKDSYRRAGSNMQESIELFLKDNSIPYLAVTHRIKTFNSFKKKVELKKYSDPFNQNEDICGVRVILYLPSDIEKLEKILKDEFVVVSSVDKTKQLDHDQFGYRSVHYIVKFKAEWCLAPNYRGLAGLKIEIQLRTILMHAWAEVEHKLAYKSNQSVPEKLKRKLSLLSAKFEEADEQFQDIFDQIIKIQEETKEELVSGEQSHIKELNLETLQGIADFYFPNYSKHRPMLASTLETILKLKLNLANVVTAIENMKEFTDWIQETIFGKNARTKTTQANLISYAIEAEYFSLFDKNHFGNDRKLLLDSLINKLKKKS